MKKERLQTNVSTGIKEVRCFFQDSLPSHQIKIMSSTELPTLNNITFIFCCCVMLWRSVPRWWSVHTWNVRDHLWCNWQEESWFYSWLLLMVGESFQIWNFSWRTFEFGFEDLKTPRGPIPTTPGFEAPKLSIFGPCLIFAIFLPHFTHYIFYLIFFYFL